jgi:hypothetical protein
VTFGVVYLMTFSTSTIGYIVEEHPHKFACC